MDRLLLFYRKEKKPTTSVWGVSVLQVGFKRTCDVIY